MSSSESGDEVREERGAKNDDPLETPIVLPRRTRTIPLDAPFFSDEEAQINTESEDICCRCCFPSLDSQIVETPRNKLLARTTVSLVETIKAMSLLFWLVCIVTVMTSYAYFAMEIQLTSYFSQILGYGDVEAARIYGWFGLTSAVWITIMGPVTDRVGAPATLTLAIVCSVMGRILLVLAGSMSAFPRWLGLLALLGFIALGDGGSLLAAKVLVTPLVSREGPQRKIAFGILYSSQNVGAMLAGFSIDISTWTYSMQSSLRASISLTRFLVATTIVPSGLAVITLLIYLVVYFRFSKWAQLRRRLTRGYEPPTSETNSLTESQDMKSTNTKSTSSHEEGDSEDGGGGTESNRLRVVSITPTTPDATFPKREEERVLPWWLRFFMTLLSERFWRFLLFTTCCIGAKTVFRYLAMIYPIYMRRTFGTSAPIGTLYAIDPIVVCFLAPLAQAFTAEFSPMRWITLGTWISCLSCLVLAFSTPSGLGLYGVAFFGIVLAVGEALWSPRLDDYTTELSGSDRLGLFMALTTPIMFISKLPASWIAAWLIGRYCPSDSAQGPCDTIALWGIIGIISAASSPLMLTLFYDVVYDPAVRQRWIKAFQRATDAANQHRRLRQEKAAEQLKAPTLNVNTIPSHQPRKPASELSLNLGDLDKRIDEERIKQRANSINLTNPQQGGGGYDTTRQPSSASSPSTPSPTSPSLTPTQSSKRKFYVDPPWEDEKQVMTQILSSSRSAIQLETPTPKDE